MRRFVTDALPLLEEGFARHGDVFSVRMGPARMVMLRHPEHCRHVLQQNHMGYRRSIFYRRLKVFLGEGLLTSEGALWKRQRRLMQPAFARTRLEALAPIMTEEAGRLVDRWRSRATGAAPVDIHAEMTWLTIRIAARTFFHADVGADAEAIGLALGTAIDEINRRIASPLPLPLWVPLPAHRRLRSAMGRLDAVVERIIAERRRAEASAAQGAEAASADVLSLLMAARDEDTGEAMSDRQLRDEVMTLLTAGHETTANLLAWTLLELARHPEIAERLALSVRGALGGDRLPTAADLPRLGYARQVLLEAMRLSPPAWMVDREAIAPDRAGGYEIPKGAVVGVCIYFAHRHPDFWPDPLRFDPGRFPDDGSGHLPRHPAYFPFGAGPRQCIGMDFALVEATLALAAIAARFGFEPCPERAVVPDPSITLRPKDGLWLRVRKREEERP